jgi:hypothetical protein
VSWQPGQTLDDLERDAIDMALRFFEQNKTRTAQALGICVRTLYAKLEKRQITGTGSLGAEVTNEISSPEVDRSFPASIEAPVGVSVESVIKVPEKPPLPVRKR